MKSYSPSDAKLQMGGVKCLRDTCHLCVTRCMGKAEEIIRSRAKTILNRRRLSN